MVGYSVVIATLNRPDRLRDTLASLAAQTTQPQSVIVVDASDAIESKVVCDGFQGRLPVTWQQAQERSAARQRNQGASLVTSEAIAFTDDDVVLEADVFEKMLAALPASGGRPTGGVSARMRGFQHKAPGRLLHWYYRLQAGYDHPNYGARLFGCAINCLPCYENGEASLIAADWLPAGVVIFDRAAFVGAGGFPSFTGYSFMEDVWLSATIGRTRALWFHPCAWFDHYPAESSAKSDKIALARMRVRNQRRVAREVMGLSTVECEVKLMLHRLFATIYLARARPVRWWQEILGTWSA